MLLAGPGEFSQSENSIGLAFFSFIFKEISHEKEKVK
jgi:hypothetical protein